MLANHFILTTLSWNFDSIHNLSKTHPGIFMTCILLAIFSNNFLPWFMKWRYTTRGAKNYNNKGNNNFQNLVLLFILFYEILGTDCAERGTLCCCSETVISNYFKAMPPGEEKAFLCQCARLDRSHPFKSQHVPREHQGCWDILLTVRLQFSFLIFMCQYVNKLFIEF